jgi:hypothetical protein
VLVMPGRAILAASRSASSSHSEGTRIAIWTAELGGRGTLSCTAVRCVESLRMVTDDSASRYDVKRGPGVCSPHGGDKLGTLQDFGRKKFSPCTRRPALERRSPRVSEALDDVSAAHDDASPRGLSDEPRARSVDRVLRTTRE